MIYRKRREQLAYDRMPKTTGCPFCEPDNKLLNPRPRKVLQETPHMQVVSNMFPYHVWEHLDVVDHLLIVPKRHISSMADLTPSERKDMINIFCEYEAEGYSNYTRAPQAVSRSLPHIHTHLIKSGTKKPRFSLVMRKPYILIKF